MKRIVSLVAIVAAVAVSAAGEVDTKQLTAQLDEIQNSLEEIKQQLSAIEVPLREETLDCPPGEICVAYFPGSINIWRTESPEAMLREWELQREWMRWRKRYEECLESVEPPILHSGNLLHPLRLPTDWELEKLRLWYECFYGDEDDEPNDKDVNPEL